MNILKIFSIETEDIFIIMATPSNYEVQKVLQDIQGFYQDYNLRSEYDNAERQEFLKSGF